MDQRYETVIQGVLKRDPKVLSKVISSLERDEEWAFEVLRELLPFGGRAQVVGITGAPGVGKSTLIDGLCKSFTQKGGALAVLLVDPTSALTGGALLGDRARIKGLGPSTQIFIRSFASRMGPRGLSKATWACVEVMDAAGYDYVFVETVGAGQDEVEVSYLAHTVVVIFTPACGDELQLMKAGIGEMAHIFLLNKADLPGSEKFKISLEGWARMRGGEWSPRVLCAEAHKGVGVEELREAIAAHGEFLKNKSGFGEALQRRRLKALEWMVQDLWRVHCQRLLEEKAPKLLEGLQKGEVDFQKGVKGLLESICREILSQGF